MCKLKLCIGLGLILSMSFVIAACGEDVTPVKPVKVSVSEITEEELDIRNFDFGSEELVVEKKALSEDELGVNAPNVDAEDEGGVTTGLTEDFTGMLLEDMEADEPFIKGRRGSSVVLDLGELPYGAREVKVVMPDGSIQFESVRDGNQRSMLGISTEYMSDLGSRLEKVFELKSPAKKVFYDKVTGSVVVVDKYGKRSDLFDYVSTKESKFVGLDNKGTGYYKELVPFLLSSRYENKVVRKGLDELLIDNGLLSESGIEDLGRVVFDDFFKPNKINYQYSLGYAVYDVNGKVLGYSKDFKEHKDSVIKAFKGKPMFKVSDILVTDIGVQLKIGCIFSGNVLDYYLSLGDNGEIVGIERLVKRS